MVVQVGLTTLGIYVPIRLTAELTRRQLKAGKKLLNYSANTTQELHSIHENRARARPSGSPRIASGAVVHPNLVSTQPAINVHE